MHPAQSTVPAALANVVQIAASDFITCALDDANVLICWGKSDSGLTTVSPALGHIVQLAESQSGVCALDDAGVFARWGVRVIPTDLEM